MQLTSQATTPGASDPLAAARSEIDRLDYIILKALAKRLSVARKMGKYKATTGITITDPERERRLLEDRRKYLFQLGVDDTRLVEELYRVIFDASKRVQVSARYTIKTST